MTINNISRRLTAVILVLLWLVHGCATMHPLEGTDNRNLVGQINVGDVINIKTKYGGVFKIRVTSITDKAIAGQNTEIALDDVSEITVKRTDPAKIIGLVLGIMVMGLLALKYIAEGIFGSIL